MDGRKERHSWPWGRNRMGVGWHPQRNYWGVPWPCRRTVCWWSVWWACRPGLCLEGSWGPQGHRWRHHQHGGDCIETRHATGGCGSYACGGCPGWSLSADGRGYARWGLAPTIPQATVDCVVHSLLLLPNFGSSSFHQSLPLWLEPLLQLPSLFRPLSLPLL